MVIFIWKGYQKTSRSNVIVKNVYIIVLHVRTMCRFLLQVMDSCLAGVQTGMCVACLIFFS